MLSASELREKLKLSRADLERLLKEGLPHERQGRARRFEPAAVRDWLVANKKAVDSQATPAAGTLPPTQRIARTKGEVAQHFGVSERTVGTWLEDETFPGKSGNPGRRDGEFPLDEIRRWWDAQRGVTPSLPGSGAGAPLSSKDRLNEIRARKAEIELDQLLGSLVAVDDVARFVARTIATAKAVLDQVPDQVLACLPPAVKEDGRRRIRQRVDQLLASSYAALAELSAKEEEQSE